MPLRARFRRPIVLHWRRLLGAALLASAPWAARSAELSYDAKQNAILLNGEIRRGDEERFASLLIDHPPTLIVRSGGGQIIPAIAIARQVRERRMTVIVDGVCGSACAQMIFAAAGERRIRPNSFVAFHSGSMPVLEAVRDELARYVESGASAPADIASAAKRADAFVRAGRDVRARFDTDIGLDPQVVDFYERLTTPRGIDFRIDPERHRARASVRQGAVCEWWIPDRAGLARLGLDLRNDFDMLPREKIAETLRVPLQRLYFGLPVPLGDAAFQTLCGAP